MTTNRKYRRKPLRTTKYRGSVVKPCFRTVFYEPMNPESVPTGV